eukprot:CAMPEP_0176346588 /NCGR_PEP_ID=MMETSP0126-20121128/6339_1 /TAXON_ID=141414 ORGANISM="Strombidinopsis acuminatum, Strain SPMC142" /NCGR_SAMPLE_ID=MMETSP0126 /ASSEMBLY_ACC=CAM_ASM_000229 /LENGTH=55 /DNA_ID=CAMNT_0017694177 /DNA_START=595 /DNA_END=762 /DNA_ORIENTATION=-
MSKHIHATSKPANISEENEELLASYFPKFMWVVRDFMLTISSDTPTPDGEDLEPR